jgi:hypothetical protein
MSMKRFLVILGMLILVTGVKAIAWIANNGVPQSLTPSTTGDLIGFGFVAVLLISFVACLVWYLIHGDGNKKS